MDQSEFDIGAADLPQRGGRSQALVRVIDAALPDALVRGRAQHLAPAPRAAAIQLLHDLLAAREAAPAHSLEEAVLALWKLARPRGCAGAEWWIGRSHTTRVPLEFTSTRT